MTTTPTLHKPQPPDRFETDGSGAQMSLMEHLEELRTRIFRIIILMVMAMLVAAAFVEPLHEYLIILLDLGTFQGIVITCSFRVRDVHHRKSVLIKDEIHHQPTDSPITITKRVNCDKMLVSHG